MPRIACFSSCSRSRSPAATIRSPRPHPPTPRRPLRRPPRPPLPRTRKPPRTSGRLRPPSPSIDALVVRPSRGRPSSTARHRLCRDRRPSTRDGSGRGRGLGRLAGREGEPAHWPKKARGFSNTTRRIRASSWPRDRISKMNSGTASGSLWPQSPAEFTSSRSGPYCSTRSAARAGVHLVIGIEGHPGPVPGVERGADRVLLDVVDADPLGTDPAVAADHVEDHPRPLVLVRQVRRVHQHQLAESRGEVEVLEEDDRLVPRVLVQPDLADAEDVRAGRGTRGSSR